MEELELRKMIAADVPVVVQMMHDFFAEFNYPFDFAVRKKQVEQVLVERKYGTIYICQMDRQIMGYQFIANTYSFEFGGKVAYLDEFYLISAVRKTGKGKQFIQLLQEELKQEGFASLRLEVENYNENAIKLYHTTGFTAHQTRFLMTCSLEK